MTTNRTTAAPSNAADVAAYDAAKKAAPKGEAFPTFRKWIVARDAATAKPAPATKPAKAATKAPKAKAKAAATASGDITLAALCKEVGMSGKRARVLLRRAFPGNDGAKWTFTAARAAEVRKVLKGGATA